jgi:uridylate kinase
MSEYRYHRVLLKLSGEALMGSKEFGIDPAVPELIAQDIKPAYLAGLELPLWWAVATSSAV